MEGSPPRWTFPESAEPFQVPPETGDPTDGTRELAFVGDRALATC